LREFVKGSFTGESKRTCGRGGRRNLHVKETPSTANIEEKGAIQTIRYSDKEGMRDFLGNPREEKTDCGYLTADKTINQGKEGIPKKMQRIDGRGARRTSPEPWAKAGKKLFSGDQGERGHRQHIENIWIAKDGEWYSRNRQQEEPRSNSRSY